MSDPRRKKKKKKGALEATIMALINKSLKATIDEAMKEIFKTCGIRLDSDELFHQGEGQTVIGLLGLVAALLLLFDNQLEVRVSSHLGSQFFVDSSLTLTSLVEAGLGSGDGLVNKVDDKARCILLGIHRKLLFCALGTMR